ncbi:transposable element Tcb2 transposase [Trichonephila clavipes]|uniref:Transposable element Tcb2 transposase n=1 Tax=Trichonephila clavipes TaxID=2585209 RepID=A0A8X6S8B4_TRICX|nr:transposable element Tcb2 transposase [Trichonephila clavipes]
MAARGLHVVANGTMTGQRYIDEVLLPHVRLFRGAVGDKLVFMDDNATCHRTLAVLDCLDSEGIQRLVWPARSPDLNHIANVWVALGRQVAGRNYPPTNKNTLIRALTEEWDKLPQQLLDNVVQSMVDCGAGSTGHCAQERVPQHIFRLWCVPLPYYIYQGVYWTWWTCCLISTLHAPQFLDLNLLGPPDIALYETPVATVEDLKSKTLVASADITSTPDLFELIGNSFGRRCRLCFGPT